MDGLQLPYVSDRRTQQTRTPTAASTKVLGALPGQRAPTPMIYEIYGIRLDPCKMLYQSTLFIVNAVVFTLDRMLSDQLG